ncbi:hypothetical protein HQN90_07180 [Paenibacillus alba]|uniref:hypothetical protein n=1 Tax=Paenibacillus alba TaxID=1197127 RepID=UPI001566BF32|nr:hypothetical protein [Paenibacillus alba]NQX65907.1 hypothetical protein [Paenibacillus alba]
MKPTRKNRNQAFVRHQRKVAIARKKKIAKQTHWLVTNERYGRLSKNKVHCSCPLCSDKTALIGFPKSQIIRLQSQAEQ